METLVPYMSPCWIKAPQDSSHHQDHYICHDCWIQFIQCHLGIVEGILQNSKPNKNDGDIHPQKICVSGRKKNEEKTGCIVSIVYICIRTPYITCKDIKMCLIFRAMPHTFNPYAYLWLVSGRKEIHDPFGATSTVLQNP